MLGKRFLHDLAHLTQTGFGDRQGVVVLPVAFVEQLQRQVAAVADVAQQMLRGLIAFFSRQPEHDESAAAPQGLAHFRDNGVGPTAVIDKFLIPPKIPDCRNAKEEQVAIAQMRNGEAGDCVPKTKPTGLPR